MRLARVVGVVALSLAVECAHTKRDDLSSATTLHTGVSVRGRDDNAAAAASASSTRTPEPPSAAAGSCDPHYFVRAQVVASGRMPTSITATAMSDFFSVLSKIM